MPLTGPKQLFITTNNVCNYKCIFCDNPKQHHSCLTLEKIASLIDSFPEVETVDISGYGEVILHPYFKDLVGILKSRGKKFSFSTNGFALSNEIVDVIENSSLSIMNVSLNSLNTTTYKYLTGGGDLTVVLNNLDYLFKVKRKFNITVSAVINAYSIKELSDFIKYGRDKKPAAVRFIPLTANIKTYPLDLICTATPENRKYLSDAESLAKKLNVHIQTFSFDNNTYKPGVVDGRTKCFAPFSQFCINQNGDVHPCCWLHLVMGNINETSWQDIWNNEKYNDLRNSIFNADLKYCKDCREFN